MNDPVIPTPVLRAGRGKNTVVIRVRMPDGARQHVIVTGCGDAFGHDDGQLLAEMYTGGTIVSAVNAKGLKYWPAYHKAWRGSGLPLTYLE